MEEVYKQIPGYTRYQISNYGNIRSLKRNKVIQAASRGTYERPYVYLDTGKRIEHKRYGKKPAYEKDHRHVEMLVAESFVENPHGYSDIRHIDGNIKNNRADNLEWCKHTTDPRRNARSVIQMELNGEPIKAYPNAKIAAQAIYGAPDCIRDCCNGGRKTSYGFKWKWGVLND